MQSLLIMFFISIFVHFNVNIFTYFLDITKTPYTYIRRSTPATQKDNEVCGGDEPGAKEPALRNYISGIRSCTGWTDITCHF